jgi:hypothetical protein
LHIAGRFLNLSPRKEYRVATISQSTMPDHSQPTPPVGLLIAAAIVPVIFAAIVQPPHFIDDAGFFLRYAEHLAAGDGFVFNPGEPPIWGATAPLWPLLIAGGSSLGLEPEFALLLIAYAMTSAASIALTWVAARHGGLLAGLATVMLCTVNTRYLQGAFQGMETPLSVLLIAAGLVLLSLKKPPASWLGLIVGLSLVHKIDFAIWGVLLLAVDSWRSRRLRIPVILRAAAIAATWYIFAWSYFGQPWPNSFTTKLAADYGGVGQLWFIKVALGDGGRKVLFLLAIVGVWQLRHERPLLASMLALGAAFTLAYTLFPPAEAFEWYTGPLQPILILLAALGLGHLSTMAAHWAGFSGQNNSLAIAAVLVVGLLVALLDKPVLEDRIRWASYAEGDRVAAAKWVRDHTATDARVVTSYGNAAYYCDRYVYDSSHLNRLLPVGRREDFVMKFHPEAIIDAYFRTGLEPNEIIPPTGYELARVYESARVKGGFDFFVIVLLKSFDSTGSLPESMQQRTVAPGP